MDSGKKVLKINGRSKRSISKEWNLEIMVVADSKMKRYHGENLEMYILTLMTSVSLIFKDPTIGNNINISIVKLIIMSEDEDSGIIFPSASKTLRNFCRWQQELNTPQGYHHDTAILLTREDLCRHSRTCDTLGLAQSGMACDRESSCAVVEDNGLSAAFTIAHEIGHILGIPHDDDTKCNRFHQQGQRLHVMARMLDYNSYPWTWSDCSRHFITTFLDAGYGHCLLSKSKMDLLSSYEHAEKAAGELYDMDYQCELVFGKGSRICPFMPVCKRLWCTMEDFTLGGCRTQHMPWADGTRCGPDKSCLRGECVLDPVYETPAQNGEWGQWQSFGTCSRSCGGGIARSIRECDNPRPTNGGRYCVGERIRYKSCQTQNCPLGSTDFREEQCRSFNGKTFGFPGVDANVKWVPHYTGVEPKDSCKLYCRAAGTAAYFLLKERVIDGTTCGPETYDLCINGKCMRAGCDHKLDSHAKDDVCGICGGNGTSCRVIRGKSIQMQYGYNDIVVIPAGASNIEVLQYGRNNTLDDNYLALMGSDHEYLLNGNYMISMFPKSIQYAGSLIDYSGSHTIYEKINATKRLGDDLYVQVLTVGSLHPPEVTYQYTISIQEKAIYCWRLENSWSPCNSICQGEQYRKSVCVDRMTSATVKDRLCHEQERPLHEAKVCHPECFLRWRIKALNTCSVTCGKGIIKNEVQCIQHMNTGELNIVQSQACAHIEPRPPETEECVEPCKTKEWKYSVWSQCSTTCGEGLQHRKAICIGDGSVELPDTECNNDSKVSTKTCFSPACPVWKSDQWSQCSSTCGFGQRRRRVACFYKGNSVSGSFCNESEIPSVVETCHQLSPCPQWHSSSWEQCSVTCGSGVRKRRIICTVNNLTVSSDKCDEFTKPTHVETCKLPFCVFKSNNHPNVFENMVPAPLPEEKEEETAREWRTGNWSSCSSTCGVGMMYRQVICLQMSNEKALPDKKCNRLLRPTHIKTCHLPSCGRWTTGKWSECTVTCGTGIQTRRVLCTYPDETNSSDDMCNFNSKPKKDRTCHANQCLNQSSTSQEIGHNNVDHGSEHNWRTGLWGKCSKSCGGGVRRRQVACYDGLGKHSSNCDVRKKPTNISRCNLESCPLWILGEWSKCSTSCGKGIETRLVHCIDFKNLSLTHDHCAFPIPDSIRRCKNSPCLHWAWTPWSQCSTSCGTGTQTRYAQCRRGRQVVHEKECRHLQKTTAEIKMCKRIKCVTYHWKKQKWSKCSSTCGKGYKQREIMCYSGNITVEDQLCNYLKRPKERRKCYNYQCSHTWMTTPWSECSHICGKGIQVRNVTCHHVNAYKWINPLPVPQNKELWCNLYDKPSVLRGCNLGNCSEHAWVAGSWSACNVKCGIGRQRRRVHCRRADGKRVSNTLCGERLRPQRRRRCQERPCAAVSCQDIQKRANVTYDGEQEIFVRGRYVKIYCAKMNSSEPQEYITLIRGDQDNYSEVYNKRLTDPTSCPYGGSRYDACHCTPDESIGPGLTTFQRIAVNITSLVVLTHDWTFSLTQGQQPIPFAEAGDCYSMASCPQAEFDGLREVKLSKENAEVIVADVLLIVYSDCYWKLPHLDYRFPVEFFIRAS
ncbi:a disintegrin and metalloproteinase with thrombospondin motifs 9 [Nephila pilipes]|uniref:A disintegrin and metalloproteinase with thrombospondin motifs 9 n=1 Tax=Nephila pilipes TaxID=299642 RepID=A0A8X6QY03_NEPPI|nr:a disintegrin and metalloproteinase with thrombospondin motifs 9 [Nephila pilipes]